MDGIESKIAKDMLKPASGLVDALLSAKIEKLRTWAHKKELLKNMKEDKLQIILEKYILRVLKRSSELSTIVFPQRKILLETVYEPIHLGKGEDDWIFESDSTNYSIDPNSKEKSYLIVDKAGMGKSTYSKNLSLKLLNDSDFIPILFELSEYDSQLSLIENLAISFDDIDSIFNRDLFKKLIVEGYFFIIFDGFDEAPSEHQDILRKQLREFNDKKGLASLLVTSRPHERLPDLTDTESYSLKKLSKDQAISLIKKYDLISKASIGESLSKDIENVPDNFLETPLLVGLLYRTYGFNNSIAQKISVFYSEIYDALYKGHDLTKSGFVRKKESGLDIDEFRQLLRAFSFLYIAKSSEGRHSLEYLNDLAGEAQELCSFDGVTTRDFLSDLLLAVPLIYRDGNTYKFMHRSIAEYFSAEYICNTENKKKMLETILLSPSKKTFEETIEYVHELSPSLYQAVVTLPIAKSFLKKYLNSTASDLFTTMQYTQDFVISYWKVDDVVDVEDSNKSINIPQAEGNPHFSRSCYMYGFFNDIRYVACCSSNRRSNSIPDGAWADLTDCLLGDDELIDYMRIESDKNIEELASILDEGTFYNSTSLIEYSYSLSIIELLARQNMRFSRKLDDRGNSTRVLSLIKCKKLVEKVSAIHEAQNGLSNIMQLNKA